MEDFKNCKKCGAECNADFKFCPNCGASLEDDKCLNCGAELMEGAKFCFNCGAPVGSSAEAEEQDAVAVDTLSDKGTEDNEHSEVTAEKREAPVRKSLKINSAKANFIIRIIKNAAMLCLCIILFGLSFANIFTVKADNYFPSNVIEGVEVEISAVDIISIMRSTAEGKGAYQKYAEEKSELEKSLQSAFEDDYNDRLGKIVVSAKTKSLLSEYVNIYLKYALASEDMKGGSMYNNIIIAGVLCLLNIFFASAMLIVSVISLVSVLLRKKNRVSKYLYAMPLYLFISLLILFIIKTTLGSVGMTVAGAMVATLFFEIIALILTILLVVMAAKGKSFKNAVPKLVSLAMSLVICGCLFAPVLNARYDLVLDGKSSSKEYCVSVDASGLLTYLPPEVAEEFENRLEELIYSDYMEFVKNAIDNLSELSVYEFDKSAPFVTSIILYDMMAAIGKYNLIGALSTGYYVLLLVFLLFGAFAVWTVATLFKRNNSANSLLAAVLVFIIVALACSIGWISVLNYHLDGYDLSFTVGGGLIAAAVVQIITFIVTGVLASALTPKKRKVYIELPQNDEETAE